MSADKIATHFENVARLARLASEAGVARVILDARCELAIKHWLRAKRDAR
jgi:hypothetical protein